MSVLFKSGSLDLLELQGAALPFTSIAFLLGKLTNYFNILPDPLLSEMNVCGI